jgi:glycerol uptake facilitator-like aquaporin
MLAYNRAEDSKIAERDQNESLSERHTDSVLDDPNKADGSNEALIGRRKAMLQAVYSEFIGTICYFVPTFGILANNYTQGFGGSFNRTTGGLVSGITLVCMIMCFSSLSGAIFNPAITFSLWITRKLSNRKCISFMVTQLAASVTCMLILYATFPRIDHGFWISCVVTPLDGASTWNVFFTEFVCTFILTYAAFAMAFEEAESAKAGNMSLKAVQESDGLVMYGANPTSKMGFAPFALGFVVFSLSQYGGGSGASMNPVRQFGPAVFAGEWDSFGYYMLGQFLGAGAAALLVVHGPQSGERNAKTGAKFDRFDLPQGMR